MNLLFWCFIGYLCGSITFGSIFAKIFRLGNLQKQGSGNIGATNLARVSGSKILGLLVALLDGIKGLAPIVIARYFCVNEADLSMIASMAVIGHIFPLWHRFKGGKGIATFIGVNLTIYPYISFIMCVTWLVVFLLKKISSLASISMMIIFILCNVFLSPITESLSLIVISLLIIFKHKDNIKRLIKGSEKSI